MRFVRHTLISLLVLVTLCAFRTARTNGQEARKPTKGEICAAPNLSLAAATPMIRLPCSEGGPSYCDATPNRQIQLVSTVTDNGGGLTYKYSTTGGRIVGDGTTVMWDFSDAQPGRYSVTVEADNNCGCTAFATTTVLVEICPACPPCPTLSVTCPSNVREGMPVTFSASLAGGASNLAPTYNWSVSAGTITSGQGSPTISVDSTGLGGQSVTATVVVGGVPLECAKTASCSFSFPSIPRPESSRFDQYPDVRFNDEKARLDNFGIQLQNSPGARGYIVAYGGRGGPAGGQRATRARDYLINTRGIDSSRVVVLDGGCRQDMMTELWIAPTGAAPPAVDSSLGVPCGPGTGSPRRRTPRRRMR